MLEVLEKTYLFMHEFDAAMAPPEGWPLLVEITEPAETPPIPDNRLFERVLSDIRRTGILPKGSEIIGMHTWTCDPAYVVFSLENQPIVEAARSFLESHGVTSLGRYGSWEYSGMSSCLHDGFSWASSVMGGVAPAVRVMDGRAHVTGRMP